MFCPSKSIHTPSDSRLENGCVYVTTFHLHQQIVWYKTHGKKELIVWPQRYSTSLGESLLLSVGNVGQWHLKKGMLELPTFKHSLVVSVWYQVFRIFPKPVNLRLFLGIILYYILRPQRSRISIDCGTSFSPLLHFLPGSGERKVLILTCTFFFLHVTFWL